MLAKVADLLPTHTRRSEESQSLQQFSTPLPLGVAALTAAGITPADRVLEPSAGTGLLAILAVIRSEEHTSELQSLMRLSYAAFCFTQHIYDTNLQQHRAHVCTPYN